MLSSVNALHVAFFIEVFEMIQAFVYLCVTYSPLHAAFVYDSSFLLHELHFYRILIQVSLQVQAGGNEWTSNKSNTRVGSGDDNVEVTRVGIREQRCANTRHISIRRLLIHRHFVVGVRQLFLDLRVLLHMGVYQSLHGEVPDYDHEAVVVRRSKEV